MPLVRVSPLVFGGHVRVVATVCIFFFLLCLVFMHMCLFLSVCLCSSWPVNSGKVSLRSFSLSLVLSFSLPLPPSLSLNYAVGLFNPPWPVNYTDAGIKRNEFCDVEFYELRLGWEKMGPRGTCLLYQKLRGRCRRIRNSRSPPIHNVLTLCRKNSDSWATAGRHC